ncbi:MAG: hypothetical protein ACF8R7_13275 [Phycisphaerales bacterium JB039]
MTPDEAAEQFLATFKSIIAQDVGQTLAPVRTGEPMTNPFTQQAVSPERTRLHAALSQAGLLDDPQFCTDLATLMVDASAMTFTTLLTLHDGGWLLDDGSEIELRTRGGEPLPKALHERFGMIEPIGNPQAPQW